MEPPGRSISGSVSGGGGGGGGGSSAAVVAGGPGSGGSSGTTALVQKKLIVVGDPNVGKTSLLTVFKSGIFPTAYEPTVFENSVKDIAIDGKSLELLLWDTAGQEGMDRVRVMSYNKADCVLLCFSVDSTISFENIHHKWLKEVLRHCKDSKLLLVGLKTDLRGAAATVISEDDAKTLATKLELDGYVECSAKSNKGVGEVFETATRLTLAAPSQDKKKCLVM